MISHEPFSGGWDVSCSNVCVHMWGRRVKIAFVFNMNQQISQISGFPLRPRRRLWRWQVIQLYRFYQLQTKRSILLMYLKPFHMIWEMYSFGLCSSIVTRKRAQPTYNATPVKSASKPIFRSHSFLNMTGKSSQVRPVVNGGLWANHNSLPANPQSLFSPS